MAHLPGFAVAWRLTTSNEMPYKTTLLGGRVDVGDAGMRVMGLLWLAGALGFVIAAVMTWRATPGWPTLTLLVTLVSLVLSVLAWPDSRIGVAVNVAIVALLLVGGKAGWFPGSR
jgi:CHASE2 domain-containing sensor protein